MLTIVLPATEQFDASTNSFLYSEEKTLYLEHSLLAVSCWEARWKKSFLSTDNKTAEEIWDYICCMSLKGIQVEDVARLSSADLKRIEDYIRDPMTATVIHGEEKARKGKILTSEEIYYAMAVNGIPFTCERWHLNRLLTLLRVFAVKNKDPKKMSRREILSQQRALNEARRKKFGSSG